MKPYNKELVAWLALCTFDAAYRWETNGQGRPEEEKAWPLEILE